MADASLEIQTQPAGSTPDSRWHVLAGLRFLLAMVVVAGHMTWFQPPKSAPPFLQLLGGTSAVLGFLIVSGYSIGHSLQRRPIGFFQRRVLRIYPLYATAVLYALLPFVFLPGIRVLPTLSPQVLIPRPTTWVVVGNLLMLQNLVCPPIDSNMLVWTLGIEVVCYLLAPWFQRMHTIFLAILILISAAGYGWLYPHLVRRGYGHYATLLWGLPLLMFAWAWIAGFLLHRFRNSIFVGIAICVLGIALLHLNREYEAPYSVECFVGAIVIVTLAPWMRLPGRMGSIFNYLGDLSYPVYLFHLPTFLLGYCILNVDNVNGLLAMALACSAAFLFIESILKPIISAKWSRDKIPTAG
jgi:peptidoglycan/LPS O-acetylase OafA/YrhL